MSLALPPPHPVDLMRRVRFSLLAFALISVLNLGFEAAGPRVAFDVTKPLLMPALAIVVASGGRAPRALLGALFGSWAGDTALLFSGNWFLVGMAGFAAAHICYIRLFVCGGAPRHQSRLRRAAAGYGVLWLILITLLWPDLASSMRIPVACYSLLLATMATFAYAAGPRTAVGGALFLISDSLIAGGLAHWHLPAGTGFVIMATYIVSEYLLATGALALSVRPASAARIPD